MSSRASVRATADTALGQRIDNISVSVDGGGGRKNSAIAIIQGTGVVAAQTLSASVAVPQRAAGSH